MYVERNTGARSRNHCCCGKTINITYSECVSVTLVIQHAKRMLRIIQPSLTSLAPPYFFTLSHKRQDFGKKFIANKMRVLSFSTSFTRNISHFKNNLASYCHKREDIFM